MNPINDNPQIKPKITTMDVQKNIKAIIKRLPDDETFELDKEKYNKAEALIFEALRNVGLSDEDVVIHLILTEGRYMPQALDSDSITKTATASNTEDTKTFSEFQDGYLKEYKGRPILLIRTKVNFRKYNDIFDASTISIKYKSVRDKFIDCNELAFKFQSFNKSGNI